MDYAIYTPKGFVTMIKKEYTMDDNRVLYFDEVEDATSYIKAFEAKCAKGCCVVKVGKVSRMLADLKANDIGLGDVAILVHIHNECKVL